MASLTATRPSASSSLPLQGTKTGTRAELLVSGLHCANCIAKIEKGLAQMPGVTSARLNFSTSRLSVEYAETRTSAKAIIGQIAQLGFSARPYDPDAALTGARDEGAFLLRSIALAGVGVVFVSGLTDTTMFGFGDMGQGTLALVRWLSALVAVPVTLLAGRVFFRSALKSLTARSANMDVPISLAILASLALSVHQTIIGGSATYFDAAVMLPFLLLIGRYLDHQLRHKAKGAALDLVMMQAAEARQISADGTVHSVEARNLAPGDRIMLATGERSPVDGLLEGGSAADLSLVTGESEAIAVASGRPLHAGSVIVGAPVPLRVTARVEDSLIAELTRLIEAGQQQRSKYVRLADRAAALYVPLVHGLALAVFVVWLFFLHAGLTGSLINGIAVLIVTCPCALGLAVPAVQVVATGKLFQSGLLVKTGDALERLAEIDAAVFDKTGTLTEGRPSLLNAAEISSATLAAAAELARASRHPLARALADAAGSGPVAANAQENPGLGVSARANGMLSRLGSAAWLGLPADHELRVSELCFQEGNGPVTRFHFGDTIRSDAGKTVHALRDLNIEVEMLSGDQAAAAKAIASQADIARWQAPVSPQGKVEHLRKMRAMGLRTLMVGDGLNDAAALASAHVSISPGTALDVAQAQADIVLRSPNLMPIAYAVKVARAARRHALQNFAIAILYNAVAIPLAAAGMVTPLLAAVAMATSSVAVTLNALRLSWTVRTGE